MPFVNRDEAARRLADRLAGYRGSNPLVLAVPRGAVPMGAIIAEALEGELDVALVQKLRAPQQRELAIGSVDETGEVYLAPEARAVGATEEYLAAETEMRLDDLKRRRREYTPIHPPIDPAGRLVIIVDDGIATGASMRAAVALVRRKRPARLVVATAVAPPDTVASLQAEADEIVCLETPRDFLAVGAFFQDFSPVSDETVADILRGARGQPATTSRPGV